MSAWPEDDMESRIGVAPLSMLAAEKEALIAKVADLRAKYGAWGTFDHIRKIELARIAGAIRAQAVRDKIKRTEADVDDASHASDDYREFITLATQQRAEWVKLEAQIEIIDARIYRGNALTKYASMEPRV